MELKRTGTIMISDEEYTDYLIKEIIKKAKNNDTYDELPEIIIYIDKRLEKEEKNDLNIFDKEKSQSGENLIYDKDNIDLDIDNINEEKKNNSEIDDEIIRKNTDEENINITNDNNEIINSEKKTYDIPGLLQDDLEKSKSNKISNNSNNKSKSNMEIDNENELEEEEYNIRKNKYDFFLNRYNPRMNYYLLT